MCVIHPPGRIAERAARTSVFWVMASQASQRSAPIGPLHGVGRLISRDERDARVEAELTTPEGVVVARARVDLRILKSRTNP